MGDIITLDSYRNDSWSEVFVVDGPHATLQVYLEATTGDIELVQSACDGEETIRTTLTATQFADITSAVARASLDKKR